MLGFTIYSFTIYYLNGLENKTNLFYKRFGSPEKSTTFAAALREKPGTDLLFIHLPFTI